MEKNSKYPANLFAKLRHETNIKITDKNQKNLKASSSLTLTIAIADAISH